VEEGILHLMEIKLGPFPTVGPFVVAVRREERSRAKAVTISVPCDYEAHNVFETKT